MLVLKQEIHSHSFILRCAIEIAWMTEWMNSGYFYSASSSPLLLRGAPDNSINTVSEVNTLKRYRQLWVKDLPKVPTWQLELNLNLWTSECKALNLPLSHHTPLVLQYLAWMLCKQIRLFSLDMLLLKIGLCMELSLWTGDSKPTCFYKKTPQAKEHVTLWFDKWWYNNYGNWALNSQSSNRILNKI